MVFPEIAVQMIEDIPFSEAPERGEKGVFIAVPRQAVQDDIRAQRVRYSSFSKGVYSPAR